MTTRSSERNNIACRRGDSPRHNTRRWIDLIYFYSGTPGSGKSLRVARDIVAKLKIRKQNVITNMSVNYDYIRTSRFKEWLNKKFGTKYDTKIKDMGRLYYVPDNKLTVEFLYQYAMKFHKRGVEGQTLLIIDEAQMKFAPNTMKLMNQMDIHYRQKWLDFFTQHRHLGYNIIVVSQFDRLIDPQVRCLFEYECRHRKINNYGAIGMILSLFKFSVFVQVEYWYGLKARISSNFFLYSPKYAKIYDSYKRFDDLLKMKEKMEKQGPKKGQKIA